MRSRPTCCSRAQSLAPFAAREATQTIPIVIITADDPVALGLARTIAKPGGNVTGTWFDYHALVSKRLEFLRLALPAVARVGAIVNPDDPTDSLTIPLLPAAARALGMTVEQFDVRDVTKLDAVAAAIERAGVGALLVGDGRRSIPAGRISPRWWRACDCRPCTASGSSQRQAA